MLDAFGSARIVKLTGGFYTLLDEQGALWECRARGLFRKDNLSPLVGDRALFQKNPDGSGTVTGILPRGNFLLRPPVANLDLLAVVVSLKNPPPNLTVLDTLLATLEHRGIPAVLAITKTDLEDPSGLARLYRGAGYAVYPVCCLTGGGIPALEEALRGKLCAFSGNSGAGKSSLLNALAPRLLLPVGDFSKKLGRGRHTTRHVELFSTPGGALIADTPGFSSADLLELGEVDKQELAHCFLEFRAYAGRCRFTDCSHTRESGCAVREAAERGEIAPSRYQSYEQLYNQVKDIKEWERRKNPSAR